MPYADVEEGRAHRRAYQRTEGGKAAHARAVQAWRERSQQAIAELGPTGLPLLGDEHSEARRRARIRLAQLARARARKAVISDSISERPLGANGSTYHGGVL